MRRPLLTFKHCKKVACWDRTRADGLAVQAGKGAREYLLGLTTGDRLDASSSYLAHVCSGHFVTGIGGQIVCSRFGEVKRHPVRGSLNLSTDHRPTADSPTATDYVDHLTVLDTQLVGRPRMDFNKGFGLLGSQTVRSTSLGRRVVVIQRAAGR